MTTTSARIEQHPAQPSRRLPGEAPLLLLQRSGTLPVTMDEVRMQLEMEMDQGAGTDDVELQSMRFSVRAQAQDASKNLLTLMHAAREHLRFWEALLQAPPAQRTRVLVLQTGARSFAR